MTTLSRPAPDDAIASVGPFTESAVAAVAVLLVVGFWGAVAMGVPVAAAGGAATLVFAGLMAFVLLAEHSADMIVESDRDLKRRFVSPSS